MGKAYYRGVERRCFMKQRIFAVMGASGHIGHAIVEDLLKRGHIVRAIGRSEEKLRPLMLKGAEGVCLNFEDAGALSNAFTDAYAVFTMIPPSSSEKNYGDYQDRVGDAICQAIKRSGTKHVVNLSSIGADLDEGTGPIKGLHRLEKRLDALEGLDFLVHLRPDFFMENVENYIPMIKSKGVFMSPYDENLPIAMVATRDIGWKAADFLDSTAPLGHLVFEFIGPKDVTMNHVAEVFGVVFDHPGLKYQQISMDDARKGMLASGMSPDLVDLLIEMYEGFNSGLIVATEELKPTHRGITTFEEYAHMLAHKLFSLVRE